MSFTYEQKGFSIAGGCYPMSRMHISYMQFAYGALRFKFINRMKADDKVSFS